MKMYACPDQVPAPEFSWDSSLAEERQNEIDHMERLETWLRNNGWDGKHTGRLFMHGVGDGSAQYMVGVGKRPACLVHLPYGDAWHYPDAKHLPQAEVIRRSQPRPEEVEDWYKPRKKGVV